MGFPQLFGSDYVLPAIIVVVLLAAVVGLIVLRRRQQGRDTTGAGDKAAKTPAIAGKSTRESRKAAALAAKAGREAAEGAAAEGAAAGVSAAPAMAAPGGLVGELFGSEGPAGGEQAPAPEAASVQAPENAPPPPSQPAHAPAKQKGAKIPEVGPAAAMEADPLQTVLTSILSGWGDLTTEDTNRLEVFRRDRVLAAIQNLELPKESKGAEYAKTRLTQLRRYAAQLEHGEPAAPREVEVHEFAGMAFSGATDTAPGGGTATGSGAAMGAAAAAGAGAAAAAAGAGTAGAAAPASTTTGAAPLAGAAVTPVAGTVQHSPRAQTKSWYAIEPEEPEVEVVKPAPVPRDWTSTPTGQATGFEVEEIEEIEETAGNERAAEFDWGSADEHIRIPDIKGVDLAWNHEPTTGAPPEEVASSTPPAQPTRSAGLVADFAAEPRWPAVDEAARSAEAGRDDEAARSAEAAVAAAAAAFWDTPEAPRMEKAAGMFGRTVSSAADIMALPASERVEMLAFLEPHELIKVMQSTQDKTLKKGVIDTLGNIGSTAALNAIQMTLDDPDPEVQLYALDAAERLLGNNNS